MATGSAKVVVKDYQGTAFCVVSLDTGHWNIHVKSGCNYYLRSYLSRTNYSKKLSVGEFVVAYRQGNTFSCLESDISLDNLCTEGVVALPFLARTDVAIMPV